MFSAFILTVIWNLRRENIAVDVIGAYHEQTETNPWAGFLLLLMGAPFV